MCRWFKTLGSGFVLRLSSSDRILGDDIKLMGKLDAHAAPVELPIGWSLA